MAYIGKSPALGNFVKLDAISVVNGQAAYTMQNGNVNFTDYSTINQFLVSLNGIIQSPTSSFTVSGSTITFASNLVTNDIIDFIIVFGNSLSAGTVSDSAITTAKLADSAVTTAKLNDSAVTTAKLNDASVSLAKLTATGTKDTTTFLRGDNTFAAAGGGKVNQVIVSTSEATEAGTDSYNSYADFSSNPTISITPSATSSKILIEFSAIFSIGNSSAGGDVAICDSSNNVIVEQGMYGNRRNNLVLWKLHSANTTSQVTYKIRGKINSSGGHFIYMDSGSSNPKRTVFWRATEILA